MAIPVGTTSRQLRTVARWMLAALLAFGMLLWWWPGFRAWGAAAAGLMVLWGIWLLWRTVDVDRSVPGHPFHVALVLPTGVLVWHVAGSEFTSADPYPLASALTISLLCQIGLTALTVVLTQSLLADLSWRGALLRVVGGAMMIGAAAAVAWGEAPQARASVSLLGLAGVAVWLAPLWRHEASASAPPGSGLRAGRRVLRLLVVGAAAIVAVLLGVHAPTGAVMAAVGVGAVLVLAGVAIPHRRRPRLLAGGFLVVAPLATVALRGQLVVPPALTDPSALGFGGRTFEALPAAESGLALLTHSVGLVGVIWLGGVLCGTLVMLFVRGRNADGRYHGRAICWSVATVLATLAYFAPGGMVTPAVTLAVGLTWGLLPAMDARPSKRRSGAWMLLAWAGLVAMLAITRHQGLVSWATKAFGGGDAVLHASVGLFTSLLAAWLAGARRYAWGVAAIVAVAGAGGAGEILQQIGSDRSFELRDWVWHAIGCAAALLPYSLAVGSRLCESPDARPPDADDYAPIA